MLSWQKGVLTSLNDKSANLLEVNTYCLIGFGEARLILNLIPLINDYRASELIKLQSEYKSLGVNVVNVWEDVWYSRKEQVLGRIHSMLGLNKRVHARKTRIQRISQPEANVFLESNHLQGSARGRYKLALIYEETIVAVACFSNLRRMKSENSYRSAEVVRFASAIGLTVTGGFSKLLKYFISEHKPDDIMSYADRDWSLGNAYMQAGFLLSDVTPPADVYVDERGGFVRYFTHRLPNFADGSAVEHDFIKIFNTGNLKYILHL